MTLERPQEWVSLCEAVQTWHCLELCNHNLLTEAPNTHSLVGGSCLLCTDVRGRMKYLKNLSEHKWDQNNGKSESPTCAPPKKGVQQMEIDLLLKTFWAEKSGTRLQQVKAAGGKCAASMECHPKPTRGNKEGKIFTLKVKVYRETFACKVHGLLGNLLERSYTEKIAFLKSNTISNIEFNILVSR